MSYKNLAIFVTIFILTNIFISCQIDKSLITTPEKPKTLSKDISPYDTSKGDDKGSRGLPCDQRIEVTYVFHHYEPKSGYTLGIWPHNFWENDINKFNQLRTKWGFTKYFLSRDQTIFNRAISPQVGFLRNNIWVGINENDYLSRTEFFGTVGAYYIDEPESKNGVSISTFNNINNVINARTNGTLFITGDTEPVSCLDPYVNIADYVMCTSYDYGYLIAGCVYAWWPVQPDQRVLWADFKLRYGTKNKVNWIGAHKDQDEFGELISAERAFNTNELWLYDLQNSTEVVVENFCKIAYNYGYLRRYMQKITVYSRCIEANCTICSNGGTWVEYNRIYGEIIEM